LLQARGRRFPEVGWLRQRSCIKEEREISMAEITMEMVAEEMFQLISECQGKKNLKATDLTKHAIAKFGEENCTKDLCKKAIRELIDSERCVYAYLGGSYIQLPPTPGSEQC
jgi:hypothetical protein